MSCCNGQYADAHLVLATVFSLCYLHVSSPFINNFLCSSSFRHTVYNYLFPSLFFFFFYYMTIFLIFSLFLHNSFFFFLNDTAPPEISPFPLHAPLPILVPPLRRCPPMMRNDQLVLVQEHVANRDRLIQQAARVPAHVQDQAIQRGRIQLLQCIRDL